MLRRDVNPLELALAVISRCQMTGDVADRLSVLVSTKHCARPQRMLRMDSSLEIKLHPLDAGASRLIPAAKFSKFLNLLRRKALEAELTR